MADDIAARAAWEKFKAQLPTAPPTPRATITRAPPATLQPAAAVAAVTPTVTVENIIQAPPAGAEWQLVIPSITPGGPDRIVIVRRVR